MPVYQSTEGSMHSCINTYPSDEAAAWVAQAAMRVFEACFGRECVSYSHRRVANSHAGDYCVTAHTPQGYRRVVCVFFSEEPPAYPYEDSDTLEIEANLV